MAANPRVDHLELVRRNIAFVEQNIAAGGLATVAGYLLQFELITRQNRDDALASSGKGPVDQAAMLMRMVELKIESDPDLYFPRFTEALRKSNLNNVADKLEQPATASLEHNCVPGKRTYTRKSKLGSYYNYGGVYCKVAGSNLTCRDDSKTRWRLHSVGPTSMGLSSLGQNIIHSSIARVVYR